MIALTIRCQDCSTYVISACPRSIEMVSKPIPTKSVHSAMSPITKWPIKNARDFNDKDCNIPDYIQKVLNRISHCLSGRTTYSFTMTAPPFPGPITISLARNMYQEIQGNSQCTIEFRMSQSRSSQAYHLIARMHTWGTSFPDLFNKRTYEIVTY